MELLELIIILCSVFGIVGVLLNCTGHMRPSFMIWSFTNFGWILITIYTNASVFTIAMWCVYFSSGLIGLYTFRNKDIKNDAENL